MLLELFVRVSDTEIRVELPRIGSYRQVANLVLLDRGRGEPGRIVTVGRGLSDASRDELAGLASPVERPIFPPALLEPGIAATIVRSFVLRARREARPGWQAAFTIVDRVRLQLALDPWTRYLPAERRAFVRAILRGWGIDELIVNNVRQSPSD